MEPVCPDAPVTRTVVVAGAAAEHAVRSRAAVRRRVGAMVDVLRRESARSNDVVVRFWRQEHEKTKRVFARTFGEQGGGQAARAARAPDWTLQRSIGASLFSRV